jgi:hypothetical protein
MEYLRDSAWLRLGIMQLVIFGNLPKTQTTFGEILSLHWAPKTSRNHPRRVFGSELSRFIPAEHKMHRAGLGYIWLAHSRSPVARDAIDCFAFIITPLSDGFVE